MDQPPNTAESQALLPFPVTVPSNFVCVDCGYSLSGLTVICCPECGHKTNELDLQQHEARRKCDDQLPPLELRWTLWTIAIAIVLAVTVGFGAVDRFVIGAGVCIVSAIIIGAARLCARLSPAPLRSAYLVAFHQAAPWLIVPIAGIPITLLALTAAGRALGVPNRDVTCFVLLVIVLNALVPGIMFARRWSERAERFGTSARWPWITLAILTLLTTVAIGVFNAVMISIRIFGF